MISVWKRFINKGDITADTPETFNGNSIGSTPPGIQRLGKDLQRKFARGVNYNMKVVIKGDAKVGKTSLFLRLKGLGFDDNYTPTENLNVTSINWSYKATEDVVKIDLWEVIDSTSKKKVDFLDLKLENGANSPIGEGQIAISNPSDISNKHARNSNPIPQFAQKSLTELSENFDVYKGCNAVLLMLDMTKLWTFKYVQAELGKIPEHLPVLIIANHRDQGHHRSVSAEQVNSWIAGLDRGPLNGIVMYTEASMKNGYGLKLIDKFLNIPFLKLQEDSMVKQLEINRREFVTTIEELTILQESISREYEQFLELETIKRRQQADAMSPVNCGIRKLDEATREQIRNSTMSADEDVGKTNAKSIEFKPSNKATDAQVAASEKFVNDRLPSIVIGAKCPLPDTKTKNILKQESPRATGGQKDDGGEKAPEYSDDDEEEAPSANPLVADYQSDLDSDDQR